jgi:mannose-6-phosphate isomerase-like protein (cupin superfamily)
MYATDLKKLTKENTYYRLVLQTGEHSQLVAMCLNPGEEIGQETHQGSDQMLFFVDGEGEAFVDGSQTEVKEHDVVFVPAGTPHNIRNTGNKELKLFTVYAPATHPAGLIEVVKPKMHNEQSSLLAS